MRINLPWSILNPGVNDIIPVQPALVERFSWVNVYHHQGVGTISFDRHLRFIQQLVRAERHPVFDVKGAVINVQMGAIANLCPNQSENILVLWKTEAHQTFLEDWYKAKHTINNVWDGLAHGKRNSWVCRRRVRLVGLLQLIGVLNSVHGGSSLALWHLGGLIPKNWGEDLRV